MCIIYSPSILPFWSSWHTLVTVSMVEKGKAELPKRRSKQQNDLTNFQKPFLVDIIKGGVVLNME